MIWWGSCVPLTNAGLRESGNLAFFLNSVGPVTNTHVMWDEYFHGQHGSLWDYIARTPLPAGALQVGLRVPRDSVHLFAPPGPDQHAAEIFAPFSAGVCRDARRSVLLGARRIRRRAHRGSAPAFSVEPAARVCPPTPRTTIWPTAPRVALQWNEQEFSATLARADRVASAAKSDDAETLQVVQEIFDYASRLELRRAQHHRKATGMNKTTELAAHVRTELAKAVVGQRESLDQLLLVMLVGGHALVEGVPGLAKTLAVKALAHIFQLKFQRVQCTPDLMPADILGANVYNLSSSTFNLHRGPIFTDLLLVDEINRTPPRTQSALLEAMEEKQVTIDGTRYELSKSFAVFATQNPVEFEGTYPLPEAQLDRFLVKIRISYPDAEQEAQVLQNYQDGFDPRDLQRMNFSVVPLEVLLAARQEVAAVRVEPALFKYIVTLVARTRNSAAVSLGASPRAAISLMLFAKAIAATEDRDYLIPDDVKQAAPPILRHRIVLKPEADLEGMTADQVVREIVRSVEVPK